MHGQWRSVDRVEWGYEPHELALDPEDWSRVKVGQSLQAKGDAYSYEGEFFSDGWTFGGGFDGDLTVTYGEGLDEGVGWTGTLSQAATDESSEIDRAIQATKMLV